MQGGLPDPTSTIMGSHALMAILFAAIQDAGRLRAISQPELKTRLQRALSTGDPDDDHILALLERADALVRYTVERVHRSYTDAGADPIAFDPPSLRDTVAAPPAYLDDYLDLVERIRANPTVSRDLLQTAELACFDYLLGGTAWQSPAFAPLFSAEHKGLLLVALRCTTRVAGQQVGDALMALQSLPVSAANVPDRRTTSSPLADQDYIRVTGAAAPVEAARPPGIPPQQKNERVHRASQLPGFEPDS